jgi:hypothetical protein
VVGKLGVFGSFLSERDRINDIDIAITLSPKYADDQAQRRANQKRIDLARAKGRRFRNIADELYWPQHEVMLFLRSRSRAFSFHSFDEPVVANIAVKVLVVERSARRRHEVS